jgi:DtxR family Mn-dependent transcriptional regulator
MAEDSYTATYREYVGAIYELGEEGLPVIQARIAGWLGVSRASVSEMIRKMESDGLVTTGPEIALTSNGRHLAEVVVRRHRLAERFLTEVLGLPWVKVHAEAEVWELAISDDVEAAMLAKLGQPTTCPHGNPIPGAGYRQPDLRQMSELSRQPLYLHRVSEELELDNEIMGFRACCSHPRWNPHHLGKKRRSSWSQPFHRRTAFPIREPRLKRSR